MIFGLLVDEVDTLSALSAAENSHLLRERSGR